ncbi:peroxiredoxin [Halobaculum gomorrense]|uniref:thioredoxin-dependent peroxiredoxin n=1 Tax=Halobaculum gomorrense TaxID=43928 RepID=A0A1M5NPT3_9EURY|nr:peroxiredoxin [Halobaculum gomorrense]SHG91532.1 peroxiredoxin Q/BCP [Halobaculum gomorrense]
MLDTGDTAPAVTARNQNGTEIDVEFEAPTVVYFYPKDFTGGCTIEANEFEDALPAYRDAGVDVYGVSMDDAESHAGFADEEGLSFDLLADPDGEVARSFGLDTDEGYTDRRTFLFADGEVVATYDPELSDPSGHAREVLADAEERLER